MPKKRLTPELRLALINEVVEKKRPVTLVCREYGVSRYTFYKWFKCYQAGGKRKSRASFSDSKAKGKAHFRSVSSQTEKIILDLVLKNPSWSTHKICKFLKKYKEGRFFVSNHGVQNVFFRNGLNTEKARRNLAKTHKSKTVFASKFSEYEKYLVLEEARLGLSVTLICRKFHISRYTFYSWLKKYVEGERTLSALAHNRPKGESHFRYAGDRIRQAVLEVISANPSCSVHKVHAQLGGAIGHHAIQNFLEREGLNTYEKRLRFAQGVRQVPEAAIAPLYIPEMPLYKLRHLIAHFATVPKLVFTNPKRGLPYALVSLFSLVVLFLWIRLLFITPYASPLGLFFSSMALFFGLFFFIYSMKYYLTVLLVLRLAQGGGATVGQGRGLGKFGVLGKLGEKLLGLRQKEPGHVNPLSLNLDKITLRTHPFVSIHVALYNEKRVVERLIRACEVQEYFEEVSKVSKVSDVSKGGGLAAHSTGSGPAAYEVIIADDSTDETTAIAKQLLSSGGRILDRTRRDEEMEVYVSSPPVGSSLPIIKLIHRFSRSGFKGAALQRALENTNPKAMYISVFDADFVPYPDTIEQFVKTFQELTPIEPIKTDLTDSAKSASNQVGQQGMIAAVQGYQWHVLNKSQTWITRGVRTEYAGSYVIERAGEEIYGGLKQIAGSVYAIRADILRQFGWGTSITEDFELTLRLYEKGYKVAFTPYIQAPAEAVSTIKRLVRQRMRWAEGASYNIKIMLPRLLFGRWEAVNPKSEIRNPKQYQNTNDQNTNLEHLNLENSNLFRASKFDIRASERVWVKSGLTRAEKLEFAYLAPYYLQAAFFVIGTFSWFISEAILGSRLPFWTAALGWSLVFTNILALPLMNIVGLFLEESEERDYIGILSFMALSYIVVPFQAYAAIKGFVETSEGPWFRTPKTGMITDTFGRSGFSKFFGDLLGKKTQAVEMSRESGGSKSSWGMGFVKPALAFRLLQGNNFNIRPRQMRWAGNLALGLVIAVTVLMTIVAPLVPQSHIYAQKPMVKTIGASGGVRDEKINADQPSEVESIVEGEEITKSRMIPKTAKDGKKIEYVFSREPKVRIKLSSSASAGGFGETSEIEFETKSIGGRDVRPKMARIYGEGQVVYEEAIEGIDIKYTLNGELITEEFILKNRNAADAVGDKITQNIRTVGVKVVSPNPEAFGFYTENNEELFKLSQPFAKDDDGIVTNDLSLSLDKTFDYTGGYRLTKTLGSSAQAWLKSPIRAYPVSIDPSIIVTGGIASAETQFGGLQRKLAYVNSNWYAFYNDGTDALAQKSSNGTTWTVLGNGSSDLDGTDADNYNPSVSVSGNIIHAFWLDESGDQVEGKQIDTGSSDALGTLCGLTSPGAFTVSTYMVTAASVSTTEAVVAYSNTSNSGNVDIFDVTGLNGTCTVTDVSPGNINLGSGITAGDRPVVFALSSTKVGMVFQDGNLSYSELDINADDWTKNNLALDANGTVADSVYSVTSDQAATPTFWVLTASAADATDSNFYTCCSSDFATTTIDSDVSATNGQDNVSDVQMFCPAEDNCKIVYTDAIDSASPDLVFVDCNDATCSSLTKTTLNADIGDAGDTAGPSIYCVTDGTSVGGNCKVVAGTLIDSGAVPDLFFYDCINDEDCSTNVVGTIDTDFGGDTTVLHTAIYCPADADCKVVYNDAQSSDESFVDCGDTACTAAGATITDIDGTNGAEPRVDLDCSPGATDCKVVMHDTNATGGCVDAAALCMIDCGAAACTSPILGTIDGDAGTTTGAVAAAVDCVGDAADCKVVYGDQLNSDFDFVDCGNTACSSTTITTVDATGGSNASNNPTVSMDCFSATDCKVVYVGDTTSTSENLYILDCDAAACTTGSVIEIGSTARFGADIVCLTSTNCKVVYYSGTSSTTPTLVFLDCDVANCFPSSTDVTTDDPWQVGVGSNIETVSLTYRSDNASLYANIIQDVSDLAYYKSTLVSSISWSGQTDWGFTGGALNEISSPERVSAEAQVSVVLNKTDANGNFEFANVPENIIYLVLLAPFTFRLLARRRREAKVMRL